PRKRMKSSSHTCLICHSDLSYFFTKTFNELDLGAVDYHRCGNCGFTISKTHFDMSDEEWGLSIKKWGHEAGNPPSCPLCITDYRLKAIGPSKSRINHILQCEFTSL